MCNNICNKCHQCTDICSCRAKLEPCATTTCKEKISTDCVWYRFGNQSASSKLLCFLGVSNNTNLTTILEKLDEKLCPLFSYHPSSCARQLLGLPATTDILFILEKILTYICTATDEKVKVTPTDTTGGYLNDKIEVGDCLVKTVVSDSSGNQKLRFTIDFNCVKSKLPTCVEVNCTNCSPTTPVAPPTSPVAPSPVQNCNPIFGTPIVNCQGNNTSITVSVSNAGSSVVQFSSDEGVTWVTGNPYTFVFPSTGALQKIKAKFQGCNNYVDGYIQLCNVTPVTPTSPVTPVNPVAPTSPVAPSPVVVPTTPITPVAPSPVVVPTTPVSCVGVLSTTF